MSFDLDSILANDRLAVARAISAVERGGEEARRALVALYPHTGRAHVVGVTGAPGSGKSTLVCRLAAWLRARGLSVGIVAVDPSSPFTGGALLGDRVRMQELSCDPGVFIRSMANRGSLGGLAETTVDAVAVLDAAGYQVILVETVGTGQAEVDVARAAHTIVVVVVPGMGDDIQAAKAGILEIADILVVNKADWENAERTIAEMNMTLQLGAPGAGWIPPVLPTVATQGTGVDEVAEAIGNHRQWLQESGGWEERQHRNARQRLLGAAQRRLYTLLVQRTDRERLEYLVQQVAERRIDPYAAADALLEMGGCPATGETEEPS
ncbi:MAG: methylmalonyl Co-A mutase-associated GTPase MeaB [Chloroflexi bacterium]|nr:methylmalonyl Co-A mutase-associated GTPase MeaB [Chloroflexota bacterium]